MKIFDIKQFSPLLVACLTFVLFTFVAKTALLQVFSIGVILIFGWVIVKKGKIFRKQDIGIIEEINMPKALKRAVKNVITVLA